MTIEHTEHEYRGYRIEADAFRQGRALIFRTTMTPLKPGLPNIPGFDGANQFAAEREAERRINEALVPAELLP